MSRSTPQFDDYDSSSKAASKVMRGNRSEDTTPELLLRKALWHRGWRYRKNVSSLPGKPDIVFRGARLAIFCDGDFWHGRNWEEQKEKLLDGANPGYWVPKIEANRERDQRQRIELEKEGWTVLRIWESEIKNDPEQMADRVEAILEELVE